MAPLASTGVSGGSGRWLPLGIILAAYLPLAGLYAVRTPAWQVPDEPAHYNYLEELVRTRRIPVIEPGEHNQVEENDIIFEKRFAPGISLARFRYEDWQPPLYYLAAAPLFVAGGGALLPLRLLSVVLGAGVVAAAFLVAREVAPTRPALAAGTAAFVAFLPGHLAVVSGFNNDVAAELVLAGSVAALLRLRHREDPGAARRELAAGVVLALVPLTKLSCYPALALVAWVVARRARAGDMTLATLARLAGPAAVTGALLWGRNALVYGPGDPLGLHRHNAVVIAGGTATTSWWIGQFGWSDFLLRGVTLTYQSFWGLFGWMEVPLPREVYVNLGVLSALALLACGREALPRLATGWRDLRVQLLAGWLGLTVATFVGFNVTFVQHQGRYLYPALIPIALLIAVGVERIVRPLPPPLRRIAFALPYAGLAALALWALSARIVPGLTAA